MKTETWPCVKQLVVPTVEKLRKAWLGEINRTNKYPKKVFICSDHFKEKLENSKMACFARTDFYKAASVKNSVPFIFSYKEQTKL